MATEPVASSLDSLAGEWQAALTASAESNQPEPAKVEGSTPTPEAAPVTAPVESPSAAQPPAPVVENQALAFALEKAGISKDDPEALAKIAQLFVDTNNRAGEMGRKLQALEKQPEPQPIQQAQPQPTQAPPVTPQQPAQTVEQHIANLVQQDPNYQYLVADWETISKDMDAIATHDARTGRLTGGRMAEVNQEINQLTAFLGGAEALKRLNLQAPELDTFQQQEIRGRLSLLAAEKAELKFNYLNLKSARENVQKSYSELRKQYTEHYEQQVAQREAAEQEEKEINTEADKFRVEWKSTFEALATEKKAPKEMLTRLWNNLKRSAKSSDTAIMDLRAWMNSEMEEELKALDEYHRYRSGQYATDKRQDAQQSTQPANPAAVAPPAPGNSGNWEEDLLASRQQVYGRR